MEDNKALRLVYTFFLGLLLAIFIGVGINTFYVPPKAPEFETTQAYTEKPTAEQNAKQQEYDRQFKDYLERSKPYNQNVSMITLAGAVILLAISLGFEKKIKIISDGVMLGGLFTLIYSLGRGFASENSKYVFAVVSVGLVIVLYLGYHKFVRTKKSK